MNSTTTYNELRFTKQVTCYVQETLTFNDFKKRQGQRQTNESEEQYNERCVTIWNKLCESAEPVKGHSRGCIEFEDADDEVYEDDFVVFNVLGEDIEDAIDRATDDIEEEIEEDIECDDE
jgi:hypothetical protein